MTSRCRGRSWAWSRSRENARRGPDMLTLGGGQPQDPGSDSLCAGICGVCVSPDLVERTHTSRHRSFTRKRASRRICNAPHSANCLYRTAADTVPPYRRAGEVGVPNCTSTGSAAGTPLEMRPNGRWGGFPQSNSQERNVRLPRGPVIFLPSPTTIVRSLPATEAF